MAMHPARRWTTGVVIVASVLLVGSGCAGETVSDKSDALTLPLPGPKEGPTSGPPATIWIKAVRKRLVRAGYHVSHEPTSRFAKAALIVDDVTISQYTNADVALADLRIYRVIFDRGGELAIALKDKRLYLRVESRVLTARDRAAFRRIVRVAEGH